MQAENWKLNQATVVTGKCCATQCEPMRVLLCKFGLQTATFKGARSISCAAFATGRHAVPLRDEMQYLNNYNINQMGHWVKLKEAIDV